MNVPATSQRRAYWLKTMHQWHWISSAIALLGIMLFSVTGITLNHAEQMESQSQRHTSVKKAVPTALVASLAAQITQFGEGQSVLTPELQQWLRTEFDINTSGMLADWSEREIYLALPQPGGDGWLRVDLKKSITTYDHTDSGWMAYLNDLHKGRHTGVAWTWFIDLLAVSCVIFSITGLVILKMHAMHRPWTWPLVALGVLIPFLLAVLFVH